MEDDQSRIIYETITNFKNKDETFVLNSIRQTAKIVGAIGVDRTVKELLPYLQELLTESAMIVSALLEAVAALPLDLSRIR